MFANFLQVLLVVSASIPAFLFLSVLLPELQGLLVVFWLLTLVFDLRSTHKFYAESPEQFKNVERNKIFAVLVENLDFKKATLVFPLLVEVPLILLFAFLPLQITYAYMFNSPTLNPSACLAAAFGVAGVGHTQATLQNFMIAKKKTTHRG